MKPYRTLMQRLVHLKDVIPEMERLNVVYDISCAGCPGTYMYLGETKRRLGKRRDKHQRTVQKADTKFLLWLSMRVSQTTEWIGSM